MSNHITALKQDQIDQVSGAIICCIPPFPKFPGPIICPPWPINPTIPRWEI